MWITMLESLATMYQYWTNATGGVYFDHECVIRVAPDFNLIVRDTDVLCKIVYGS